MIITFEPWRPDLGETAGGGNIEATGVVPGINAYEPQPALRAATDHRTRGSRSLVMTLDVAILDRDQLERVVAERVGG